MADAYWRAQLTDLEPSLFPDLTGKSSSARSELLGVQTVESVVHLSKPLVAESARTTFLSACFKILALYTGEQDVVLYHSPSLNGLPQIQPASGELPLRIRFGPAATNSEILTKVEDTLECAQRHGTPSREVLQELSFPSDCPLANTLAVFSHQSTADPKLNHDSVAESYDKVCYIDGDADTQF